MGGAEGSSSSSKANEGEEYWVEEGDEAREEEEEVYEEVYVPYMALSSLGNKMSLAPHSVSGFRRASSANTRRNATTKAHDIAGIHGTHNDHGDEGDHGDDDHDDRDVAVAEPAQGDVLNSAAGTAFNSFDDNDENNLYAEETNENQKKPFSFEDPSDFISMLKGKDFKNRRLRVSALHSSSTRFLKHSTDSIEDENPKGGGAAWFQRLERTRTQKGAKNIMN